MQSMELAGQKIVYKDLMELRMNLTELLQKLRRDREGHDQESKRIRREEKNIEKMLGVNDATSQVPSRSLP